MLKNKYFIVESSYVKNLTTIFSVSEEVIVKTIEYVSIKLGFKLFIINYNTLIEDLGDIQPSEMLKTELIAFKNMVYEILTKVIALKKNYADIQSYEPAARFRDLEIDLKKIYFPSLIKPRDISTIHDYFARNRRG